MQMNVVCGRAGELPAGLCKSLGIYRHKVFVDRLGWELKSAPGCEWDQFDRDDTVHVVARDSVDDIIGCGRLLPTTDSYLLKEVFPELLNGVLAPCSEKVWELSRFAAMGVADRSGGYSRRQYFAERLLLRALQFCSDRGATQMVAVSTLPVERLMHRAGLDVHRFGPPIIVGSERLLGFVIAVNERSIAALSKFETAGQAMLPMRSPLNLAALRGHQPVACAA